MASLTALEIDPVLARRLESRLGGRVNIVEGDGTALPFDDASFSSAFCFTMLHHVPSPEAQNRLFAEVARVLCPGSPFAGTDSTGRGLGFALLHIGDTRVVLDPGVLGQRLVAAGFDRAEVSAGRDAIRFRAYTGAGKDRSPAMIFTDTAFSGGESGHAHSEL